MEREKIPYVKGFSGKEVLEAYAKRKEQSLVKEQVDKHVITEIAEDIDKNLKQKLKDFFSIWEGNLDKVKKEGKPPKALNRSKARGNNRKINKLARKARRK